MRTTLVIMLVLMVIVAVIALSMRGDGPSDGAAGQGGGNEVVDRITGKLTTTFLSLDTLTILLLSVLVGLMIWWVILR